MATNIPVNGAPPSEGGIAGVSSVNTRAGDVTLSKTDVGLSSVENTSDASKPISTATQTALNAKIDKVVSVDNTLPRFDGIAGAVQGSGVTVDDTNNVTGIASLQLTGGTGTEGKMSWNAGDGTVDIVMAGQQVTLQVGQEQLVRVLNNTGLPLTDGQVVYITGSQGNRPTVALADADTGAASDATIGLVTEPIANNAQGFVTRAGLVRGVDTSAFAEGTQLYLSGTAGTFTGTPPAPPAHAVRIGWVVRQHATVGIIFVDVQNGYQLADLHDVLLTGLANGQILTYDATAGLWKNTPDLTAESATVSTALTFGPNADVYQNTEGSYGWRDNIAQFVVKGSGAADPSFGSLFNGLEGYLFSATTLQRVFCDFHIDHDIARGTVLYPHVHWMPTTTATGVVRWGIEYSVAKGHQQGAASTFPATTTVYVNQTISAPSQWQHFVAEVSLADAIPSTNIEPDSVIKVRVFRDAANAADTYNGAVHAWQCDLHYQASRFATLNKAPNFYA